MGRLRNHPTVAVVGPTVDHFDRTAREHWAGPGSGLCELDRRGKRWNEKLNMWGPGW